MTHTQGQKSDAPPAGEQTAGRDQAIDLIRGYCIVSMVAAHLAGFSIMSAILHLVPKFDGASGFVLLGGLVLGMVQRRRLVRDGIAAVVRKSLRRLVVIYGAQIFLVIAGVAAALHGWDNTNFPRMESLSPADVILHSVTMTLAPPGGDVLRLYVFFLALAVGAYLLLKRGRWIAVMAGSFGLHLVGQYFPELTSFSPFAEQARSAGWAGWQFLFISALVLGWYWKELNVPSWLDRNAIKILPTSAGILIFAGACGVLAPDAVDEALFSKYTFSMGRIVVAYAVVASLYLCLRRFLRWFPKTWLRPISMIGRRSLDSYVIQALAVVLLTGFMSMEAKSPYGELAVIGTLFASWGWAELRAWWSTSR